MHDLNTWWKGIAGERFWLGTPGLDGNSVVLAAPCGGGRGTASCANALVTHVKPGDAVFHFDEAQQAIVAWSIARGSPQKRRLAWSGGARAPGTSSSESRLLPSWTIGLDNSTLLDTTVPVEQLARTQWELFPALRELEDLVGDPLHYPFAMGSPAETHLLPGYAFKLPAFVVEQVPPLARVAGQMWWSDQTVTSVAQRPMSRMLEVQLQAR